MSTMKVKTSKLPWDKPLSHDDMARKCKHCGSKRPGMQPLRLNGQRGFWHLKCFEVARKGRVTVSVT